MSIDPQEHCVERQLQRAVTDHDIRRTVKYGIPEPDPQGHTIRVKRSFEGVTVITEGKRIVTTWRGADSNQPLRPVATHLAPVAVRETRGTWDTWDPEQHPHWQGNEQLVTRENCEHFGMNDYLFDKYGMAMGLTSWWDDEM